MGGRIQAMVFLLWETITPIRRIPVPKRASVEGSGVFATRSNVERPVPPVDGEPYMLELISPLIWYKSFDCVAKSVKKGNPLDE